MGDYELYRGYLFAQGIRMPSYGISELNIYDSIDAYKREEPIHCAVNDVEAKRWVDEQPEGTISNEELMESMAEMIPTLHFMPEKGKPLPEYVAKELYSPEMVEVMVPPVSEYGRVVAADTARGYKEFLESGGFIVRSKLDESAWSSEDVGYLGNIVHSPSGNSYSVQVHVFFDQSDPARNVVRFLSIWEEIEGGAPEVQIWEGDLDKSGGIEANKAIAEFEVTGRGIQDQEHNTNHNTRGR